MHKLPKDQGIKIISVSNANAVIARNKQFAQEQFFFEWWKKGVALAGYQYFGDSTKTGFENAAGKNDLRPLSENIEKSIGLISDGEVVFLATMYCFYNDFRGAELCVKAGVKSVGNIMVLDVARREVIAGLLITYCGW